jgi:antitoxin component of MazEF toxin-antitoxin module
MYGRRVRLGSQGNNLRLTIPREVIKHFGLSVGDEFDMLWEDTKLIIDLSTAERSRLFGQTARTPGQTQESVEAA